MDKQTLAKARTSRDPRFDGLFFVAVKTTGIYCRPICPAPMPKEENVEYFDYAHKAAMAGYRPCLRCRPDSAPGTPAWRGVSVTMDRAKRLIDAGALQTQSLESLCTSLGVGTRHLRQIFEDHLGISPKAYALFRQCDFAKNLLHQTALPITEIAYASGFSSVRRFNDCFKKQMRLTPSQVRKSARPTSTSISLKLHYRPPYDWESVHRFFVKREVPGLEFNTLNSYGRNVRIGDSRGEFIAVYRPDKCCFEVEVEMEEIGSLQQLVAGIRRILDLDSDSVEIGDHLSQGGLGTVSAGVRLPGTWTLFEAGVRAILGQQISLVAATRLVRTLVDEYNKGGFPPPEWVHSSSLSFLRMPQKRRDSLRGLAEHFMTDSCPTDVQRWQSIPGIGPWTINYARMRGLSDPDVFLAGDLVIKKALQKQSGLNPDACSPFRSYLTLELWKSHS